MLFGMKPLLTAMNDKVYFTLVFAYLKSAKIFLPIFDIAFKDPPVPLISGVTKGPADPAVRGGAILGGRQIVV